PFSGEMDPYYTSYGPAAIILAPNTLSQHQKATAELASPAAQPDLAATGCHPSEAVTGHTRCYQGYHYIVKDSSPHSPEIPLVSNSSLPLAEFRVPGRPGKVRLLPFAPSAALPPIEKFVPRPRRLFPVDKWKQEAYSWQWAKIGPAPTPRYVEPEYRSW